MTPLYYLSLTLRWSDCKTLSSDQLPAFWLGGNSVGRGQVRAERSGSADGASALSTATGCELTAH